MVSESSIEGLCIPGAQTDCMTNVLRRMFMADTAATGAKRQGSEREVFPEILQLHGYDHLGMILVSTPLTSTNYLTWSCSIKRALRAKTKLGFIDGSCTKPDVNDAKYEQWMKVDSMVTTWILNSISKDIVQAYTYAKSSRNLWLDLELRYGGCNGRLLYQLQRSITSLAQGNLSLADYYMKLKMLWDKLIELKPTPQCTCHGCTYGATQAIADSSLFAQLLQFFMGLSEEFDNVRQQILVMESMPSINKAYSMVASVGKQRMVHLVSSENVGLHTQLRQKESLKESHEKSHWKTEEINIVITVRGLDTLERLVLNSMEHRIGTRN
ncbi:UNVERIFIED_CONTAM: hypothetical protein Sangu_2541100 [Sesamum angustifolium]|uniref:Retrotransposon Copia-like N-terminal domain-containing protein n=1 Tax=Sesamum angustifolium TaxID=2727405 RepID=A0AAW2JBP3_9LAMI